MQNSLNTREVVNLRQTLQEAQQLRKDGYLHQSISKYRQVFTKNPLFISKLISLGSRYYQESNFEQAIACYQKVLEIERDNKGAYQGLANLLKKLPNLEEVEFTKNQKTWEIAIKNFSQLINVDCKLAAEVIGMQNIEGKSREHIREVFYIYLAELLLRHCKDINTGIDYLERVYKNDCEQKEIYHNIWQVLNLPYIIDVSNDFKISEDSLNLRHIQKFFSSQQYPSEIDLTKIDSKQRQLLEQLNLQIKNLTRSLTRYGNSNKHRYHFNFIDELNQSGENIVKFGCVYILCPFTGKSISSQVSFPIGDYIFYRFVSKQEVFYLILSRNSPGHGKFIYFPRYEIVLGSRVTHSVRSTMILFKTYMVANCQQVTRYINTRNKKKLLAMTGTCPHLGHTLLNELSAYYTLYKYKLLENIDKFFLGGYDKWSFKEVFPEISDKVCIVTSPTNQIDEGERKHDLDAFLTVLKGNYFAFKPLQNHKIQQKLADRVKDAAKKNVRQKTLDRIKQAKLSFPLVCFEIRSRNRRVWLSQIESIASIVEKLHYEYPNLGIILAGWTCMDNNETDLDLKNTERDNETVKQIVSRVPTKVNIISIVGCTVQEMIAWADAVDLYVYGFGTGINFYGISKKPGIVHSNRSWHGWSQEHFKDFVENGIIPIEPPIECINDENPKEPADTRNYDIDWKVIYSEVNKIIKGLAETRQILDQNYYQKGETMATTHSARRINFLAQQNSAKNYLEIGTAAGKTFFDVNIQKKVAVDTNFRFDWKKQESDNYFFYETTSDNFFADLSQDCIFDMIFVDGLHTFEQTLRDFINSIGYSSKRTVWLIDDTFPKDVYSAWPNQKEAVSFRKQAGGKGGAWHGDVYKVVLAIHDFFPLFSYCTIQGVGNPQTIVWYQQRQDFQPRFNSLEAISRMDYFSLLKNKDLLNFQDEEVCFDTIKEVFNQSTSTKATTPAIS